MSELKSEHLLVMLENDRGNDDIPVPRFVAMVLLEDVRTLLSERDALRQELDRLRTTDAPLVEMTPELIESIDALLNVVAVSLSVEHYDAATRVMLEDAKTRVTIMLAELEQEQPHAAQ